MLHCALNSLSFAMLKGFYLGTWRPSLSPLQSPFHWKLHMLSIKLMCWYFFMFFPLVLPPYSNSFAVIFLYLHLQKVSVLLLLWRVTVARMRILSKTFIFLFPLFLLFLLFSCFVVAGCGGFLCRFAFCFQFLAWSRGKSRLDRWHSR